MGKQYHIWEQNYGSINKRIVERLSSQYDILQYGYDNLYPNRMKELRLASPLVKSATSLKADFINGEGWENKGDEVINQDGETLNDILRYISEDKAVFDGYALWINSDGNGDIQELYHIPFEYVRYRFPVKDGQTETITGVALSNNWERESQRHADMNADPDPIYLPLYNPLLSGLDAIQNGMGMVLYQVPRRFSYPTATLDAVMNAAAADAETQIFELSNLTNGFLSATIFRYPSDDTSEEEQQRISEIYNNLTGTQNANRSVMMQVPEDFTGSLIEQIPANNNDSLVTNTFLHIRETIIQHYNIPPDLLGVVPTGSFITTQQIADSYTYYNLRTKNERLSIERVFEQLGLGTGKIQKQEFINPNLPIQNRPEQVQEEVKEEITENGRTEDNIES